MSNELNSRLDDVRKRIDDALVRSGRSDSVTLLAVSKRQSVESMAECVVAGQACFGENYVQEAWGKWNELQAQFPGNDTLAFHLTGPLQRNKAKLAVGFFQLIHTVDRLALASALAKVAKKRGVTQDVLVQVNISKEESKSGIDADQLVPLCEELLQIPEIRVRGLMSIGRFGIPSEEKRLEFREMKRLFNLVSPMMGDNFVHLSMGMSADFELAVEEGATIIRLGTVLFGERP